MGYSQIKTELIVCMKKDSSFFLLFYYFILYLEYRVSSSRCNKFHLGLLLLLSGLEIGSGFTALLRPYYFSFRFFFLSVIIIASIRIVGLSAFMQCRYRQGITFKACFDYESQILGIGHMTNFKFITKKCYFSTTLKVRYPSNPNWTPLYNVDYEHTL